MGRQKQVQQPVEGAKEEEKPMEDIQKEIANQMPAQTVVTTPGIKEQLEERMAAAKLEGAKEFLSGIFAQQRTFEDLRIILQDESVRPYLAKLAVPSLAGRSDESEPSEAAPAAPRRGRPPGRPKAAKAAKRISKNTGGRRAVFGEEEKEAYVNAALEIITSAGKEGVKRQDLVAKLDKRFKDKYEGKNWMVMAMIKTLTKKKLITAQKDGTRSIYIAR